MSSANLPTSRPNLPPGVLQIRPGPGANCSSAGSAVDVLFYGSAAVATVAIALAAWVAPTDPDDEDKEDTGKLASRNHDNSTAP